MKFKIGRQYRAGGDWLFIQDQCGDGDRYMEGPVFTAHGIVMVQASESGWFSLRMVYGGFLWTGDETERPPEIKFSIVSYARLARQFAAEVVKRAGKGKAR